MAAAMKAIDGQPGCTIRPGALRRLCVTYELATLVVVQRASGASKWRIHRADVLRAHTGLEQAAAGPSRVNQRSDRSVTNLLNIAK